jgi:ribosomal protein L32E
MNKMRRYEDGGSPTVDANLKKGGRLHSPKGLKEILITGKTFLEETPKKKKPLHRAAGGVGKTRRGFPYT